GGQNRSPTRFLAKSGHRESDWLTVNSMDSMGYLIMAVDESAHITTVSTNVPCFTLGHSGNSKVRAARADKPEGWSLGGWMFKSSGLIGLVFTCLILMPNSVAAQDKTQRRIWPQEPMTFRFIPW